MKFNNRINKASLQKKITPLADISQQDLMKEVTHVLADIQSAGKLNPEQAKTFTDYVFDMTGLSGVVRTIMFRAGQYDIDKIGISNRVTYPIGSHVEPSNPQYDNFGFNANAYKPSANFSRVSLNPKRFMSIFNLSRDFILENLEGTSVEDAIMRIFAIQFANNLEDMYLNGIAFNPNSSPVTLTPSLTDTTSFVVKPSDINVVGTYGVNDYIPDPLLGAFNGWNRLADSGHLYDANDSSKLLRIMYEMKRLVPKKYKNVSRDWRFIMSHDVYDTFRLNLSGKDTVLGDMAVTSKDDITALGIPVMPLPLYPLNPRYAVHIDSGAGGAITITLPYQDVIDVVVTPKSTAYNSLVGMTAIANTVGGGNNNEITFISVASTDYVISFSVKPQILLTYPKNFILGISDDIFFDNDKNIYENSLIFSMQTKVAVQMEELDAVVKAYNIKDDPDTAL